MAMVMITTCLKVVRSVVHNVEYGDNDNYHDSDNDNDKDDDKDNDNENDNDHDDNVSQGGEEG